METVLGEDMSRAVFHQGTDVQFGIGGRMRRPSCESRRDGDAEAALVDVAAEAALDFTGIPIREIQTPPGLDGLSGRHRRVGRFAVLAGDCGTGADPACVGPSLTSVLPRRIRAPFKPSAPMGARFIFPPPLDAMARNEAFREPGA